jgi:hypothetical protein
VEINALVLEYFTNWSVIRVATSEIRTFDEATEVVEKKEVSLEEVP